MWAVRKCRDRGTHDHNAREGALSNPSPALGAGKRTWPRFVAAEAVTITCLSSARFYSGRLRGRAFPPTFRTPRSAHAPTAGLRLSSAPPRATASDATLAWLVFRMTVPAGA